MKQSIAVLAGDLNHHMPSEGSICCLLEWT